MSGINATTGEKEAPPPAWKRTEEGVEPCCPRCGADVTEDVQQAWADYPLTHYECTACEWKYVHF